jgi:broad specificity phosphatase PhoE
MLVLVRHGRTAWNRERRLAGRTDVPLDDVGRDQARAVAAALGEVHDLRTSPLVRATETAALLGLAVPAVVDEAFVELDYGELEGTALDELDPARWRALRDDPTSRFPGGESLEDVQRRVAAACDALFATDGHGARSASGDVVVVSHVSPIKAAVAWALGADARLALRLRLDNATITTIDWVAERPVLVAYNCPVARRPRR